jgi:transposase
MFLRRNRKNKNGENYEYWTLVETIRTSNGPRQRIVATIGKTPGMDREEKVGWDTLRRDLHGESRPAPSFWEAEEEVPEWTSVDLRSLRVERMRQFGNVCLGLHLWKQLRLDEVFQSLQVQGREQIDWSLVFCLSTIACLCAPSSELKVAESFYEKTALDDLLGVPVEKVNEDRLYRALDRLLPHKDALSRHLQDRYADLFGTRFEFLIYDVTSVYFEGGCEQNPQARRGYSRDHRSDCLQVCIGLVVTTEGLPVGYEVFDGNRVDVTTLEEMVGLMEGKYGKAKRVWVFDRGIVSEGNLEYLRKQGAEYLVGTPKSWMNALEKELSEKQWEEAAPGLEVRLCAHPQGGEDTFILCRSREREEKEKAMLALQMERLEKKLLEIQSAIRKGRLKEASQAERRIGKWMGRFTKAEALFEVNLVRDDRQELQDLNIRKKTDRSNFEQRKHGHYLLRTNSKERDPKKLWKQYMQLHQAESAFRISKTDLRIRPVYHQTKERVQAHILVCFLALCLRRTLDQWTEAKGLGRCANKLLDELKEVRSMDVVLPVKDRNPLRLRVVSTPDNHLKILLHRLGLKLPNQPKIIKNVVENLGVF